MIIRINKINESEVETTYDIDWLLYTFTNPLDELICSKVEIKYSGLDTNKYGIYNWSGYFYVSQSCHDMIINYDLKSAILNMNSDISFVNMFSKLIVFSRGVYEIDNRIKE